MYAGRNSTGLGSSSSSEQDTGDCLVKFTVFVCSNTLAIQMLLKCLEENTRILEYVFEEFGCSNTIRIFDRGK